MNQKNEIPVIGEKIQMYDPDARKIVTATVVMTLKSGIRVEIEGYGITNVKTQICGIWGYSEDEKAIEKILIK